jgi:chemotaxis protein methyltransferase CheR/type IV pilus assembly protein PilK
MVVSPRSANVEWDALIEAVTNHETCFFRHAPTFRALEQDLLPGLAKQAAPGQRVDVSVWSAGCSSGEEAFSAAMVCHQASLQYPALRCSILASDVSEQALKLASAGRYGNRAVAQIPAGFRQYLTRTDEPLGHEVVTAIRQLVQCSKVNLAQPATYPQQLFDFILCQNVLVYFRAGTRQNLLDSLASCLKPGGYLLPGPGEIAGLTTSNLRCVRMGETQVFLKQSAVRTPERSR